MEERSSGTYVGVGNKSRKSRKKVRKGGFGHVLVLGTQLNKSPFVGEDSTR